MNMSTIAGILLIVCILFFAIRYIVVKKKEGAKCIGCPCEDCCDKKKNGEAAR